MRRFVLSGAMLSLVAGIAGAQAQPAPRPPAPPAATNPSQPDPAMEAAQRAYDMLTENDRRAIQDSLMWTGDYNGVVGVNFGKRAYDGIRAYQKKRNSAQTGVLSDADFAALQADAKRARDSVRFSTLDDSKTKIRIGVPLRVTEKRAPVDGSGFVATSYSSNDLALSLELVTWQNAAKTMEQSFAEETAPKPGRKVTYKFQRPDFFVVSGEDGGRTYYTRAAKGADQWRGFTFAYPAQRKGDFERIMLAIANSFDPFATGPIAAAAASTTPRPGTGPATTAPPPRPVFAATGLVIAPGKILTSAAVIQACANPIVNGAPARAESGDASIGAVILAATGGRAAPVSIAREAPATDESLVALSAAQGQPAQVASGVSRSGGALMAAGVAGGAMGAPVFDRKGQLIALVADNPKTVMIASLGATPAMNHRLAPAAKFSGLIPAAAAASEADVSAGVLAQRVAASIVAIGCAQ